MRLVNIVLALAALAYGIPARPADRVSPEEMLSICNSLAVHAAHAVESNKAKISLQIAVSKVETSINKKRPGMPADVMERYRTSVRNLYERVYALPEVNLPSAYREVIPTCVSYSRGQYTEEDVQQMKRCEAKARPYFGFANLRDNGISLAQQIEWLQREGLKNEPASSEEKKRLYADLSHMIEYVYAHPELSKRTIYAEQLQSCIETADDFGG
jgi:hypothetical protein